VCVKRVAAVVTVVEPLQVTLCDALNRRVVAVAANGVCQRREGLPRR
jgi:hypothetical protein